MQTLAVSLVLGTLAGAFSLTYWVAYYTSSETASTPSAEAVSEGD